MVLWLPPDTNRASRCRTWQTGFWSRRQFLVCGETMAIVDNGLVDSSQRSSLDRHECERCGRQFAIDAIDTDDGFDDDLWSRSTTSNSTRMTHFGPMIPGKQVDGFNIKSHGNPFPFECIERIPFEPCKSTSAPLKWAKRRPFCQKLHSNGSQLNVRSKCSRPEKSFR